MGGQPSSILKGQAAHTSVRGISSAQTSLYKQVFYNLVNLAVWVFPHTEEKGKKIKKKEELARCLENFQLVVIGSVRPPATPKDEPACRLRLDRLEADIQHRLCCMKENGGLCIRDENNRRRK